MIKINVHKYTLVKTTNLAFEAAATYVIDQTLNKCEYFGPFSNDIFCGVDIRFQYKNCVLFYLVHPISMQ